VLVLELELGFGYPYRMTVGCPYRSRREGRLQVACTVYTVALNHRAYTVYDRTEFGGRGFSSAGPCILNNLPASFHGIADTSRFKRSLKSHFLILSHPSN